MNREFASYDRYRADYGAFEQGLADGGPAWLRDIRSNAISAFDRLGFPTAVRGNERWKYTNVRPIARATFEYPLNGSATGVAGSDLARVAPGEEGWTRLVFVDGCFCPPLSTAPADGGGPRVESLRNAIRADGGLVEEHLARYADVEDDGFTAINTAFVDDGAFVRIPEDTALSAPLHLVFVSTQREQPTASYPRSLITVGRNSRLTVVESYLGLAAGAYFTNSVAEIVAEAGAEIEHYRYMMESPDAFHIGTTRVTLAADSNFRSVSVARGAKLARNDMYVTLDAPGASCTVNGLYVTSGTQHIDNHIDIDHAKPNTTSDQYFKGILTDGSRAVFSGRVLIRRDAQKSSARQADKNLMLSEGARVNTKPSMEIFADDVKAVHGATAGAVAEDALFYMRSRGLDLDTARSLLIYGFASEIIDTIRLEPLRNHLDRLFSGVVPGFELARAA